MGDEPPDRRERTVGRKLCEAADHHNPESPATRLTVLDARHAALGHSLTRFQQRLSHRVYSARLGIRLITVGVPNARSGQR